MLKNIEKQTLTVHNKMELGEDISVEAKGKGRKFVSRFIESIPFSFCIIATLTIYAIQTLYLV